MCPEAQEKAQEIKKCILLVDDELAMVESLQKLLEARDYRIVTAADGEEAVHKARHEKPDLVVLDINIPKLNGHEVCGFLRADEKLQHIPVVMITGQDHFENRQKSVDLGSVSYLNKPFKVETLLGVIEGFL